ncbi:hypothetical protein BN1232_06254 [Mycobacterium lentiflavum]|uniref:Uncharacterized protein n=2 Tax=Mycobacterium simiae complex TaxID=2249310 RepID=A0A0E3WEC9_MYCLN|nr:MULTISPECIES: hypothetical protein [Mycobacterium simiae complex]ORJ54336.1 hypothetical protein B5M45_27265 [Mycobacterium simiae]ULP45449.1 hypothetical protein MJO58_28205 [Mycobacterium lentiflavum]CQD24546.1 hypothetical protein BN1232_06254 [Mycobacterium lentiflavum]
MTAILLAPTNDIVGTLNARARLDRLAAADPATALTWRTPPPWGPVTRRQHLLIGLRLRRHERHIAKAIAALADSRSGQRVRWQRVYTAPQQEASRPEIDTWFRINCAVGDLEGLRQASTVAPMVKSTHWVIADGVTRVLVGWDLTQLSEEGAARAGRGLLRSMFGYPRPHAGSRLGTASDDLCPSCCHGFTDRQR